MQKGINLFLPVIFLLIRFIYVYLYLVFGILINNKNDRKAVT